MGALYIAEFPNGKAYVGITAGTTAERFAVHRYNARSGRSYALCRALRKYPDVTVRTLVIADDWEYLAALERRAIAAYGTFGRGGYNMTAGGEGALGYRHTPEALATMGAVHKGKAHHSMPHSAEAKAKMSAAKLGRPITAEHRANISASLMGNARSAGTVRAPEVLLRQVASLMRNSRGVSWCGRTKRWRAHITVDAKMKCLGRYATEAEALAVRQAAVVDRLREIGP